MGPFTFISFFIFVLAHGSGSAHAQQLGAGAQLTNARLHNLQPDPRAAVPPQEDPGHNTHQEAVIFSCLGFVVVFAVLCTLLFWFVVQRTKSDIRRLDEVIPSIAERMRKELITSNGELMSGTLTASHEFDTDFMTNEDVQLTSYRQRRDELQEEDETSVTEASAPPHDKSEEIAAVEAVAAAAEIVDVTNDADDDAEKTTRRENEENAEQIEHIELVIDSGRRKRRSDRNHNRHSFPQHYHEHHSPERRSYHPHSPERGSPERQAYSRRSYERHLDGFYNDRHHQERRRDHHKEREPRQHERRPDMRYEDMRPTDTNYMNVGASSKYDATGDVTLETRPPPPAYHAEYDNPGMSLRDEREYRRAPRRSGAPRTAPKPEGQRSRPKSAYGYVTSGAECRDENARPVSVIGLMDDDDARWPSMYSYTNGRKYKSLLYESHV